ncbi:glycosyltransferase [Roseovarius sp. S4756]|uniref:glycosyltransferase n=1 Tax=Roseovarius maritimus TaxID=3342637 RepID=UPI00372707EE
MNSAQPPAAAPHVLIANIFFAPYTYGGATIVAEEVAQHLRQTHGWQVSVVSAMSRSDLVPYAIQKVEKDGIANYLINLPHGRSYAEMYNNSNVTEAVARLIGAIGPDLLHLHCIQEIGAGIVSAARQRDVPVILSTHDFWWICERQFMIRMDDVYCGQDPVDIEQCRGCVGNMAQARTRFHYLRGEAAQADLITFPSHFAMDLSQRSGLTAQDAAVWPNGVNQPGQAFFDSQARRRARDPQLRFGYVGGPSHIKGWPIIRRAFSQLERDDFSGLLVDGGMADPWWKGIDLSTMRGDWKVVPRFSQKTMDDFYAEIDVLLFLSQWKETFGLTIREAIARGIRVIQTDSGGTVEHVMADPAHMLQIGDGAQALRREIEHVLDAPEAHPAPTPVDSFADQARHFTELAAPLLSARTRVSG